MKGGHLHKGLREEPALNSALDGAGGPRGPHWGGAPGREEPDQVWAPERLGHTLVTADGHGWGGGLGDARGALREMAQDTQTSTGAANLGTIPPALPELGQTSELAGDAGKGHSGRLRSRRPGSDWGAPQCHRREDMAPNRTVAGVGAELPEEEAEGMRGADKKGEAAALTLSLLGSGPHPQLMGCYVFPCKKGTS